MADHEAATENEKKALEDAEAGYAENELDDSKAKFINGGVGDETKVVIPNSASTASFSGLGKDELKKYAEDPFWVRLRWILFILFWVCWLAMLVSAIVIIVLAPRCPTRPDLKWYHTDVAYNTYAKSFFDGDKDQDGYGDLEGLKAKSGYIKDLGTSTVWLSGILKTDEGNDRAVIDHKMLDERFGTLEALKAFTKKLMKESRRVIMDLIPNQTSRNHTWFMKSQISEGKYIDYYIWSKSNNGWKREDGQDMWVLDPKRGEYYLSQFGNLPDLNLTNEDVINEFKEIITFWAGQGINGFHINDLEYLSENSTFPPDNSDFKETRNFAENIDVIDSFRKIADGLDNKPGREKLLFGTLWTASRDQAKMYFGGEGKAGLQIVSVLMNELKVNTKARELEADLEGYVNISTSNWLGWRLTAPRAGSQRVFNRAGKERTILAQVLQTTLPGSSMPYYGDEIAMENGADVTKRTITPMQWSKEANSGFTKGTPWLAVNSGYETKNMESMTAQLRDNMLMNSFKQLNMLRKSESLQFGRTMFCSTGDLFVFARNAPGFESFVVVLNLGEETDHRFAGDQCFGEHASAELVYHSHAGHEDTELQLGKAIHLNKNEALIFKFPA